MALVSLLLATLGIGALSGVFHGFGLTMALPWRVVYSDVLAFFPRATAHGLPYRDIQFEYPVLTGIFIRLAGAIGRTQTGYYIVSAAALVLLTAVTTWLLAKMTPAEGRRRLWIYWVFAPSMFIFSIVNWDMIAVFFTVAALYALTKKKGVLAAASLALGFSSKFYPVLYLVPLLVALKGSAARVKAAVSFAATAIAINIFFILSNFKGWFYFFELNSRRDPNPDSFWGVIRFLTPELKTAWVSAGTLVLFAVGYLLILKKYRNASTPKSWFLITLFFLLTNKVFSPQYTLWLLPFFVLLPAVQKRWFYTLEGANLIVFFAILAWLFETSHAATPLVSNIFVVVRHIALLALFINTARRAAEPMPRLASRG